MPRPTSRGVATEMAAPTRPTGASGSPQLPAHAPPAPQRAPPAEQPSPSSLPGRAAGGCREDPEGPRRLLAHPGCGARARRKRAWGGAGRGAALGKLTARAAPRSAGLRRLGQFSPRRDPAGADGRGPSAGAREAPRAPPRQRGPPVATPGAALTSRKDPSGRGSGFVPQNL